MGRHKTGPCKALHQIIKSFLEERPGATVVLNAVRTGVGRIVGDLLTAIELALLRVDGMGVGLAIAVIAVAVGGDGATDGVPLGTVAADPSQALGASEDDVALLVIPRVALVLLEHGELDGIDHLQVECQVCAHNSIQFFG